MRYTGINEIIVRVFGKACYTRGKCFARRWGMSKRLLITVLAVVLVVAAAAPVFSQGELQTDITLNYMYKFGVNVEGTDYSAFSEYVFLLPEVRMAYYFGNDMIKVGPGVRMITLILESMAYPLVSAEIDLDPFVFNANVGGYGFFFFGLVNQFQTGNIILPEVSAAYKLTDTMRIGTGAILFMAPEVSTKDYAYIGTIFLRWSF
jgi:hypothetical protein